MNLEPSIRNGRIVNLNDIIISLKDVSDIDYLTDYIDEIESYTSDYPGAVLDDDINKLKEVLSQRLNELGAASLIDYYDFALLYKKLEDGSITKDEEASVFRYIQRCLKLFYKEQISFDEQNALDLYMNEYLKNKTRNDKEEELYKSYDEIIQRLNDEKLKKSPGRKPLKIKPINTSGRIIAITIIEVTVLVGILLGVIAFAL